MRNLITGLVICAILITIASSGRKHAAIFATIFPFLAFIVLSAISFL
jgi:hypothetical protein